MFYFYTKNTIQGSYSSYNDCIVLYNNRHLCDDKYKKLELEYFETIKVAIWSMKKCYICQTNLHNAQKKLLWDRKGELELV